MSTHNTDGGPAFPVEIEEDNGRGYGDTIPVKYGGMTLRDYFAAKAMHAIIEEWDDCNVHHARVSELAYTLADAMLAEREKK